MGVKIPYMATNSDRPSDDSCLCLGMAGRRILKTPDESAPWNWVGNIRFGSFPVHWRLVGSPQGENEEAIV